MTEREILELLLAKLTNVEIEIKELKQDQARLESKVDSNYAELKQDQARLESKMDSNYAELKQGQARLENKMDLNHAEMLERFVNQRLDILVINSKLDRSLADQKLHRRTSEAAIRELQTRQDHLEDIVDEIKEKLEKAS